MQRVMHAVYRHCICAVQDRAPHEVRDPTRCFSAHARCGALEHCGKSSTLCTERRPRDRCGCGLLVRWGRSCSSFRTGERRRAPSGPQRAARAFSRPRSQRVGPAPHSARRAQSQLGLRSSTAPRIACTAEGAGPQSILSCVASPLVRWTRTGTGAWAAHASQPHVSLKCQRTAVSNRRAIDERLLIGRILATMRQAATGRPATVGRTPRGPTSQACNERLTP
jgi:hypothetical protein